MSNIPPPSSDSPQQPVWGTGTPPPMMSGKPLPPDDVWVKSLAMMFPGVPLPELQLYASRFRDNMFQWLNSEIQRDTKKQHEEALRFKRALEGED